MLTYNFIFKIRMLFNTLSYFPDEELNLSELERSFVNTVSRCTNVEDVNFLILKYAHLLKKINKITKMFISKKIITFLNIDDTFKYDINLYDTEVSYGNSVLTTVFLNNKKKISILSFGDDEIYEVLCRKNLFLVYTDSNYVLKHKRNKVLIFEHQKSELLMTLVMDRNLKVESKYNSTDYMIENRDGAYLILNRLDLDEDNMVASIETDVPKKDSIDVSALLETYVDDELLILIGLGILLLTKDFAIKMRNRKLMMMSYLLNNRSPRFPR